MFDIEKKLQKALRPLLMGPDLCQFALLRARGADGYRSSALALWAWTVGFLRRFCYPALIYLLVPFLVLTLMLLFFPDARLWRLFWLVAALVAAELAAGFIFHPHVRMERQLPESVEEGSTFSVQFTVTGRGRFISEPLTLDPFDYISYALRTIHPARTGPLRKGETVTVRSLVTARRRGIWRCYRARAGMAFPFGFFRFQSFGPRRPKQEICVLPRRLNLDLWRSVEEAADAGTCAGRRRVMTSEAELAGVREFRDGDPLRCIDWVGTARRGEFLVKFFEEKRARRRVGILVDGGETRTLYARRRHVLTYSPCFEQALSAAWTLGATAENRQIELVFGAVGSNTVRETADFGRLLASAVPGRTLFSPPPVEACGEWVLILQCDDPERRAAAAKLAATLPGRLAVLCVSRPADHELPPGWIALPEAAT